MSSNPNKTAVERAFKYGVPFAHRAGKTVYLVTKLDELNRRGQTGVREFKTIGEAKTFIKNAVAHSGWKTVEG